MTAETAGATGAETDATGFATPACNNGYELSGRAVTVAWKNAKRMVKEGYLWLPDGVFFHEAGRVLSPIDTCYDVWLPGIWRNHPEGRCTCPYFVRHQICKHLYFAVAQVEMIKAFAPAMMAQSAKEWEEAGAFGSKAKTVVAPAPGF